MGILQILQLGDVNVGFLVAIVVLINMIKKFDTKKILGSGVYLILVLILGLVSGFITKQGIILDKLMNGITYAGIASLIYQYWKRIVPTGKDGFEIVKNKSNSENIKN